MGRDLGGPDRKERNATNGADMRFSDSEIAVLTVLRGLAAQEQSLIIEVSEQLTADR